MKLKIPYLQEGGAAPAQAQQSASPEGQLQAMLQQYAQSHDPQLAVQICDMLVQAMGGGAGATQQAAPAQQQAFKNGGKLSAVDKMKAHRETIAKSQK